MTIKAFLFSDDEFFNSIIEEQFSSLQEYDLTVFKKITNITKAQQFEKDDIVLSYSMEQNEIPKIKKSLTGGASKWIGKAAKGVGCFMG